MQIDILIALGIALLVGYLMGRISARPVVIDPFKAANPKQQDPGDVYEGPDDWDESMNKGDR